MPRPHIITMGGDGQPQGAEPVLLCGICRLDLRGVAFQRADPCRDGIPRQRESVLLRVQHGGRHRASRTSRVGGRKLGAQPGDLAQSRGNIPFVPPQHRLPRRMVQEVAGMRPGAKDGADGPLGAAQELTAGIVQVGRFNEPVTVTGIRRARRHFNDRGCHPCGDEDGCRRNGTAADPPPAKQPKINNSDLRRRVVCFRVGMGVSWGSGRTV